MNAGNLSNGEWQNFIYLFLLLIMMLGGLFSRPGIKLGVIVKYLLVWSFIGFIAIALYAYRYEFSDFKSRILGEINPSLVQVNESGNLIINLSQDGHFYMNLEINGMPMRFMIDTGASDIVLSLNEARRIGIDPRALNFNRPYQTANGQVWGAKVILKEVTLGNVKFYNIAASVNSSDMGISLLGMSFLRQFKRYEFYRDKLILTI